jgi:antitoxin component YwqK of YwqJK toxin-antitoxin module
MIKRFIIILLSLFFVSIALWSQETNPDGYNKFYYPNGNISSEGFMKDGKPDGYWKNYYEDGTLMSEGNRLFFELDSVWNFYNPDGYLSSSITYRNGEKNGYTYIYDFYYTKDSAKIYYLKSKELYYLDSREGLSYYYDKNENLKYSYTYKHNKRNGNGKEYDKNGLVITLYTYYNGYQIEVIRINRSDNNGLKQGKWIDFYTNGNKKTEATYTNDKLNGVYKEYDLAGNVILEKHYFNGELFVPKEEEIVLKAEVKRSFYPDGKLQFEGAFYKDIPVGIHREYDENGKIKINKEYTDEGILLGEGFFDENGKRTGKWRLFDPYYNYYYGEGNYKNGLKEGKWIFYYTDGNVEQEGIYSEDVPDREWIWYYPEGTKKREESYLLGKLEGQYKEYDRNESVITTGEYFDDAMIGEWISDIGDLKITGAYDYNVKTGEWKQFYNENNKKAFVGSYVSGDASGTHTWYYPNGTVKLIGEYRTGKKHKDWKSYSEDGTLFMTYTYRNGIIIKIDGTKTINAERKVNK